MRQETVTVQKIDGKGEAHQEEMPIKVWESIGEDKNEMGWMQVAHAPREVIELKSKSSQKEIAVESEIESEPEIVGANSDNEEPKQKRAYKKK